MPSRNLPLFTRSDVESHKSEESCYVTLGENVYDLTDFIESHPGGGNLILDYAGKDVTGILKDEISHTHSETAYEILDDSLVGFLVSDKPINGAVATNGASKTTALENRNGGAEGNGSKPHPRTGMSSAEDLSKETDYDKDYKTHKFLDLNRPLFPQIWYGGYSKKFYLEQVHRPRHYKGGQSAPLFGNFLEPLTKTPWWIIPTLYWPIIAYGTWYASRGFENHFLQAGLWVFGFYFWTIIEYVMHRFLFHLDEWLPDNRVGITAHFLLHGIHHYVPMDKYRLVLPPTLFLALVGPFWKLANAIFYNNTYWAATAFCGGMFGYTLYDMTHYFLHHENLPFWYKDLKKYHLAHHFLDYELGFGVTSRFWDRVFGTELPVGKAK